MSKESKSPTTNPRFTGKEPNITPRNNNPRKGGNTNFRGNTMSVSFKKTSNTK